MSSSAKSSEKAYAKAVEIGFIVVGLAVFFGLGAFFLRGVLGHLKYLTADEKHTVTAKFVSASRSAVGKEKRDADGSISQDYLYDITYEYVIDGQTYTYVREGRQTYSQDDIELRMYRNSGEELQITDFYGMWAGVQWVMLALSAFVGFRFVRSGVKGLRKMKNKPADALKPAEP